MIFTSMIAIRLLGSLIFRDMPTALKWGILGFLVAERSILAELI